jgi:hypothetical protein
LTNARLRPACIRNKPGTGNRCPGSFEGLTARFYASIELA